MHGRSILHIFFCASLQFTIAVNLRKEIRNLTRQEWDDYMDAILVYKYEGRKDGRDYMVDYDHLVAQHAMASMNTTYDQAHGSAAFIVWQSLFVREFEIALQSINPNVTVPYWDWTIDAPKADPGSSVLFTDDYFGTSASEEDYYVVNSSKMAYFPVNNDPMNISGIWWESPAGYLRGPQNDSPSPYITRRVAGPGQTLPKSSQFNQCTYQGNYSYFFACEWGTNGHQSGIHAGVHEWGGGTWDVGNETYQGDFLDFNTSPNDPLWFSHHAQLDRMHYYWMLYVGDALATDDDPCRGYYGVYTPSPQPPGHNLWDTFVPPFYAYRSEEQISTLGGMNVSEACYWLHPSRCNYSYPEYTNEQYDDYYGYYPDDTNRMPTEQPTHAPTTEGDASPTAAPTTSFAPSKSAKPSSAPTLHAQLPTPTAPPTTAAPSEEATSIPTRKIDLTLQPTESPAVRHHTPCPTVAHHHTPSPSAPTHNPTTHNHESSSESEASTTSNSITSTTDSTTGSTGSTHSSSRTSSSWSASSDVEVVSASVETAEAATVSLDAALSGAWVYAACLGVAAMVGGTLLLTIGYRNNLAA